MHPWIAPEEEAAAVGCSPSPTTSGTCPPSFASFGRTSSTSRRSRPTRRPEGSRVGSTSPSRPGGWASAASTAGTCRRGRGGAAAPAFPSRSLSSIRPSGTTSGTTSRYAPPCQRTCGSATHSSRARVASCRRLINAPAVPVAVLVLLQ